MTELDTKVRTYAAKIRKTINDIKTFPTAPQTLEEYAKVSNELIQHQAYFIGLYVDSETAYKQRVEELQADNMSFSRAENKAQSEEVYATFKRAKLTYDLCEQAILLLKKLITASETELKNS